MSEKRPSKPYRFVEMQMPNGEWRNVAREVPKGYADGFVFRHVLDYPSKPIRIIKYDGSIEFEHKGNGTPRVN
ncbi:hypothetical protein EKK58_02175 [Candidatus Dependentiae bacterium]|nr:MAG: hypothetical protein EKK58_02175 [Candidatus Dependentiae bacterium]